MNSDFLFLQTNEIVNNAKKKMIYLKTQKKIFNPINSDFLFL